MRSIPEINEPDFELEVLKSREPVFVNFWAAWSQRCRMLAGVLDEVDAESQGWAKVLKINVDDNPHLGLWYGIQSIPALLFFVNGEMRARIIGSASKEEILATLNLLAEVIPSIPEPNYQTTKSKT
jgi:thioredoxin 1